MVDPVTATCNICRYPSWSTEELLQSGYAGVNLDSFEQVQASAVQGCHGCKLLTEVWIWTLPEFYRQQQSRLIFNEWGENLYVHIFADGRVHDVDVYTIPGESSLMHVRVASPLPPSTHLEHNLTQIKSWLSACEQDHYECSKAPGYTPARLLDLELEDRGIVKLCESSSLQYSSAGLRYSCLSHCWGKVRSKHLTRTANYAANQAGIIVSELPKTFREAIDISRALGIRYLWIDSLCIIQDSESDWKKHVQTMAYIYEDAHVTLAAGASADDDGGFYATPDDRFADSHIVELQIDQNVFKCYVRRGIDHPDAGWPAGEVLPLMTRAWTFQERLLSRRFLLFGSKEILWECRQEVACSCSMAGGAFNPRAPNASARFKDSPATRVEMLSSNGDNVFTYPRVWQDLVSQFTSRKLTFVTDKKPALAGLANKFHGTFAPGTYLEGMWSHSLKTDMAWLYGGEDAPVGRPRDGPSWSWVYAADGTVEWPRLISSDFYQIDDLVQSQTSLPLSGILLRVSIQTWSERADVEVVRPLSRFCNVFEHRNKITHSKLQMLLHLELLFPPLPGSISRSEKPTLYHEALDTTFPILGGHFYADYRFWSSEEELQRELQNVIFMAVGIEELGLAREDHKCWVAGLALKPADEAGSYENSMPRYKRIGWLRYCTEKTSKEFVPAGTRTSFLLV